MKEPSLRVRLANFFRENPDEELKYIDIAHKFGVKLHTAMVVVLRMQQAGELESVHVIRLREKGMR